MSSRDERMHMREKRKAETAKKVEPLKSLRHEGGRQNSPAAAAAASSEREQDESLPHLPEPVKRALAAVTAQPQSALLWKELRDACLAAQITNKSEGVMSFLLGVIQAASHGLFGNVPDVSTIYYVIEQCVGNQTLLAFGKVQNLVMFVIELMRVDWARKHPSSDITDIPSFVGAQVFPMPSTESDRLELNYLATVTLLQLCPRNTPGIPKKRGDLVYEYAWDQKRRVLERPDDDDHVLRCRALGQDPLSATDLQYLVSPACNEIGWAPTSSQVVSILASALRQHRGGGANSDVTAVLRQVVRDQLVMERTRQPRVAIRSAAEAFLVDSSSTLTFEQVREANRRSQIAVQ